MNWKNTLKINKKLMEPREILEVVTKWVKQSNMEYITIRKQILDDNKLEYDFPFNQEVKEAYAESELRPEKIAFGSYIRMALENDGWKKAGLMGGGAGGGNPKFAITANGLKITFPPNITDFIRRSSFS